MHEQLNTLLEWLEGPDPYGAWGLAVVGELAMIFCALLILFGEPALRAFRLWRTRRYLHRVLPFTPIDAYKSKRVHDAIKGRAS